MLGRGQGQSCRASYLGRVDDQGRQTRASRKIVADLLTYSRQSGNSRGAVDLNEIINDAVAITEPNLSHIKVVLTLAMDLPPIVGDPEKLCQVVVNLFSSARHAMEQVEEGRVLLLRTRRDAEASKVVAKGHDKGHGISEPVNVLIFDLFFTVKPVGKGTGLGLSVACGIIQEHN